MLGKHHEKSRGEQQSNDAHADPQAIPCNTPRDERSDEELTRRSTRHAQHLCGANQRSGAGIGEVLAEM